MDIKFWKGDEFRQLKLYKPCDCGCDERDGDDRLYLSAADENGNGFTVRLSSVEATRLATQILENATS